MSDSMRKEFERWVQERSVDTPAGFYPQLTHRCRLDESRYATSWVDAAWEGWQASREALVIELPVIIDKEWANTHSERSAMREAIEWCKKRIEAVGLNVKP